MCQRVCAECPLGQGIKQLAVRWERRPPWWLMYTTVVVLSVQTSTCLSCILKHPGEVAARPQNEKLQHFVSSSTGQQPPLMHCNTNAIYCLADTLRDLLKASAPKRKAVVRLHALSFYTRTAGRGAHGETCTPTVIGLFC